MFPNWIDRRSRQKRETKQQTNKKTKEKNENNSTYHEPLSKEWVGRRS